MRVTGCISRGSPSSNPQTKLPAQYETAKQKSSCSRIGPSVRGLSPCAPAHWGSPPHLVQHGASVVQHQTATHGVDIDNLPIKETRAEQ